MPEQAGRRQVSALLLLFGTLLALLLSAGLGTLPVQARQMELESFRFSAQLARDGSLQVQETITARFEGAWNGMLRQLPLLANRPTGLEPLGLTIDSVTDEKGTPYRVEHQSVGRQRELRIFIPQAIDTRRTVVMRYRVRRAVRFYPDHDELNWNVSGNGWTIPIDQVDVRVLLPEGVRGVHASVYTGLRGARGQDAVVRIKGQQVTARSTRRLAPGEGLTLAVGFAKGVVAPRPAQERLLLWLQAHLVLLLPALTAAVLGGLWWWRGRDPAVGPVPVCYEPPEGLSPAAFAALLKDRLENRSLGATLIHLAVTGHLHIQRLPGRWPGTGGYRFTLRTGIAHWNNLGPEERHLLQSLFSPPEPGVWVDTTELTNRFYVYVAPFHKLVATDCMRRGFYRTWPGDERVITMLVSLLAVGALLLVALQVLPRDLLQLQMAANPLMSMLSIPLTLLIVLAFSWLMPRRTVRGTEVLRQCLGFREFLGRVDRPRYAQVMLTPEMFERNLPYAMVAGMTRQWVSAFRDILVAPPSWIETDTDFDIDLFGDSLSDCCDSTNRAMVSAPASSTSGFGDSSSGSSGGGSSGGGDGGGGGGGF